MMVSIHLIHLFFFFINRNNKVQENTITENVLLIDHKNKLKLHFIRASNHLMEIVYLCLQLALTYIWGLPYILLNIKRQEMGESNHTSGSMLLLSVAVLRLEVQAQQSTIPY